MNDKQQEMLDIKRFGYVVSAILLIISNISLINTWPVTPLLFLLTMYFLTASLWIPVWIRPLYTFFKKHFIAKSTDGNKSSSSKDYFTKN